MENTNLEIMDLDGWYLMFEEADGWPEDFCSDDRKDNDNED
jgi:hypothetical protein